MFRNNETPERYPEKFLSDVQAVERKECGIWLDYGTIMSELKITRGSHITRETADSSDI